MPKGYAGAEKVGKFSGGGGMIQKPKGINYFNLKDGQTAIVHFIQPFEEIQWARKWKLPPTANFSWGEQVNCVDQHEDGTPDPGYAAGLKSSWRAYPILIWRNAPVYQKKPDGSLFKDSNNNKVITGYADQVCLWEGIPFEVYQNLQEKDAKYRGLMSLDWEIKRRGASTDTVYIIEPADVLNLNQPLTPADMQLAATQKIDVSAFVKVPTYDELFAYLNGGAQPAQTPSFTQQTQSNASGADGPNPFLSS